MDIWCHIRFCLLQYIPILIHNPPELLDCEFTHTFLEISLNIQADFTQASHESLHFLITFSAIFNFIIPLLFQHRNMAEVYCFYFDQLLFHQLLFLCDQSIEFLENFNNCTGLVFSPFVHVLLGLLAFLNVFLHLFFPLFPLLGSQVLYCGDCLQFSIVAMSAIVGIDAIFLKGSGLIAYWLF